MPSPTKAQIISRMTVLEAREALAAAVAREAKETKKRNAAFAKLSSAKKRVIVAKDVLLQLETRRIVPTFGTYLETKKWEVNEKFGRFADDSSPVHEVLSGESCHVCGIGSLFVAAVDRANACTTDDMVDINDDEFMRSYLEGFFESEQLELIEYAFEGRYIGYGNNTYGEFDDETKAASAFAKKVRSPSGRLKKIMQNIVDNDGVFVP